MQHQSATAVVLVQAASYVTCVLLVLCHLAHIHIHSVMDLAIVSCLTNRLVRLVDLVGAYWQPIKEDWLECLSVSLRHGLGPTKRHFIV